MELTLIVTEEARRAGGVGRVRRFGKPEGGLGVFAAKLGHRRWRRMECPKKSANVSV